MQWLSLAMLSLQSHKWLFVVTYAALWGQISGAKVKLHNSEQGAKDRVLELSGTQEQTHAAQSLVQAYMQSSLGGGILSSSGFAA